MNLFKTRISKKILGIFFLIAFFVVGFVTVSQSIAMRVLNKQNQNYYSNIISVVSNQINIKLHTLENLSMKLAMDTEIISVNQSNEAITSLWRYRDVLQTAKLNSLNFDIGNTINIYLNARNRVISSDGRFSDINEFNSIESYLEEGLEKCWFFRKKHTAPFCPGCVSEDHMSEVMTYSYRDTFNGANGVCVAIDIEKTELAKYISNISILGDGIVFLANRKGEFVFSEGLYPDNFNQIYQEILGHKSELAQEVSFEWKNQQIVFSNNDNLPLMVGVVFPNVQGIVPIRIILWSLIGCIIAVLVLSFIFVDISNRKLFQPFGILLKSMKQVKEGNLSVRISSQPKEEEILLVYQQFNEMVERIEHLINQVYLQELRVTKTELELLQSQINPHFLFNCLNFIYQMSMSDEKKLAADMAIYLAKYFRFSIHRGEAMISLGEEMDNIETYINICMMQYPDKVEYNCKAEEKYRNILIPRLSVQTLVENAFIHGLKESCSGGRIIFEVKEKENRILIRVCNNHSKLTSNKIEEINQSIHQDDRDEVGYGLNNTRKRFQLNYGMGTDVRLNLEGDFTVSEIVIPASAVVFME